MPYLPIDLDGRKATRKVANGLGVHPGVVSWGLQELWEHVWHTREPVVGELVLLGCFGPGAETTKLLVAFGFLEQVDAGYRVRGADQFLAVSTPAERGSLGGKATANKRAGLANLKQFASDETTEAKAAPTEATPKQPPKQDRSKTEALSPNTQHPTPSSLKEEEDSAASFFAKVQQERIKHGLATERPPHPSKLGAFYSAAMLELNGDAARLQAAYARFTDNAHWKNAAPPWPFAAFMKLWSDHVPRKG